MSRSILTLSMQKRKCEFEVKGKITRSEISKLDDSAQNRNLRTMEPRYDELRDN